MWGKDFGRNGWRSGKLLVLLSFRSLFSFLSGSSWKHALYEYERFWHFKSCAFDSFAFQKLCLWIVLQRRVACYGCLLWRQRREIIVWNDSSHSLVVVSLLLLHLHSLLFLCGWFEMAVVSGIGYRKVHVSVRSNTIMTDLSLLFRVTKGYFGFMGSSSVSFDLVGW